jgi:hypothetical protein
MGLSHFNVRSIRNADGFKGLSVRRDAPMHIAVIAWLNFVMSLSFRRQSIEQLPLSVDAPAVCRVRRLRLGVGGQQPLMHLWVRIIYIMLNYVGPAWHPVTRE